MRRRIASLESMGQDLAAANDTIRLLEAEIKILTEKNEVILSEIVSGDDIGTAQSSASCC